MEPADQALRATPIIPRGLYAITPQSTGLALDDFVQGALEGGAALVQYRAKDKPLDQLTAEASRLAAYCREQHRLLIINDLCWLCLATQAAGVHLGRDDLPLAEARALLGAGLLIGASAYNELQRALMLEQAGADYVALGSFYPSPTKPRAVRATPTLLTAARSRLSCALCVIGGIGIKEAGLLAALGADLIAVSSGLLQAGESRAAIGMTAQRYVASIEAGWAESRTTPVTIPQETP